MKGKSSIGIDEYGANTANNSKIKKTTRKKNENKTCVTYTLYLPHGFT